MKGTSGPGGVLWLYVMFWAIVQDAAKVLTYTELQSVGWVESVDVIDEAALKRSRQELFDVQIDDRGKKNGGVRVHGVHTPV